MDILLIILSFILGFIIGCIFIKEFIKNKLGIKIDTQLNNQPSKKLKPVERCSQCKNCYYIEKNPTWVHCKRFHPIGNSCPEYCNAYEDIQ